MKHFGMFAWIFSFFIFNFFIVEDEGGGGYEDEDLLNEPLEDDGEEKKEDEKKEVDTNPKQPPDTQKSSLSDEDKEAIRRAREYADKAEQAEELKSLEVGFKAQYGDEFSMDEIVAHLKEMEKEEKGSGDALFNPVGIENIFLKHFANRASGTFEGGGRGDVPISREVLIGKLNKGEASDEEEMNFYAKYA